MERDPDERSVTSLIRSRVGPAQLAGHLAVELLGHRIRDRQAQRLPGFACAYAYAYAYGGDLWP
jgi:hypothetical protein